MAIECIHLAETPPPAAHDEDGNHTHCCQPKEHVSLVRDFPIGSGSQLKKEKKGQE